LPSFAGKVPLIRGTQIEAITATGKEI